MKSYVYAVRDVKSNFASPIIGSNDAQAMRSFRAGMRGLPDFGVAPSDFEFYRIGEYDSDSGLLTPTVPPVWICTGDSEV